VAILHVRYNDLVARPEQQAARVREFLGGRGNAAAMAHAVDPSRYRNRGSPVTGGVS
jgi:hypothetical protein